MATITCQDCGDPRHRVPKNTRYCKRCRLLRDLDYWRLKTRQCGTASCRAPFAPLARTDHYCSKCDPGLRAHAGPCRLARPGKEHEGWPTFSQVPICAACMRDPKQRRWLIGALTLGQTDRRKANDWKAS